MTFIPELPHLPELPDLPEFTTLDAFPEPLVKFANVWLRTSEIIAVIDRPDACVEVFFQSETQPFLLTGHAAIEFIVYLEGITGETA